MIEYLFIMRLLLLLLELDKGNYYFYNATFWTYNEFDALVVAHAPATATVYEDRCFFFCEIFFYVNWIILNIYKYMKTNH